MHVHVFLSFYRFLSGRTLQPYSSMGAPASYMAAMLAIPCAETRDETASLVAALQTIPHEQRRQILPIERVFILRVVSRGMRTAIMDARFAMCIKACPTKISHDATYVPSLATSLHKMLQWCTIVSLDLTRACTFQEDMKTLSSTLRNCTSLTHLNLSGNEIDSDGVFFLSESLLHCTLLAHLNLRNNRIRNKYAFKMLAKVLCKCPITHLSLEDNYIKNEGLRKLLPMCTSLAHLNLRYTCIGNEQVQTLAVMLPQCTSLTYLDLASNSIGNEGVRSLAAVLPRCTSLTHLDLGTNKIENEGVQLLEAMRLQCTILRHLNLVYNYI